MKRLIILLLILTSVHGYTQTSEKADQKAILKVLKKQRLAWSDDNIEEYMDAYWKSDSLTFYGKNGVRYGWENILDHYLESYPTKAYTGILSFRIDTISKIANEAYYVLGEYHIKRDVGNADGIFMLVFKKINGEWKIVADTSV